MYITDYVAVPNVIQIHSAAFRRRATNNQTNLHPYGIRIDCEVEKTNNRKRNREISDCGRIILC